MSFSRHVYDFEDESPTSVQSGMDEIEAYHSAMQRQRNPSLPDVWHDLTTMPSQEQIRFISRCETLL